MPKFRYKAIAQSGSIRQGVVEAVQKSDAQRMIAETGLSLYHLAELDQERLSDKGRVAATFAASPRLMPLAEGLSDLAALLAARTPLKAALELLAETATDKKMHALFKRGTLHLNRGGDILDVFADCGKYTFLLNGIVLTGHASSDLSGALKVGSDTLRLKHEIKQSLVEEMAYPAIVLAALVIVVVLLLLFVAPSLAPLVNDVPADQGQFIRLFLVASELFRANGMTICAVLVIAVFVTAYTFRTAQARVMFDKFLALGPIGVIVRDLEFGIWATTAGRLISANATSPRAMRIATTFVGNRFLRLSMEAYSKTVDGGKSLAGAIGSQNLVPAEIRKLAAIGEQAGSLGFMLQSAGSQAQARAVRKIRAIGQVMGPVSLLALGGTTGALLAGILSGLSSIGESALL